MLQQIKFSVLFTICLLSGMAHADSNTIADLIADSQTNTQLAISKHNLAENYLKNNDTEKAGVAYAEALEAVSNAQFSVETALNELITVRNSGEVVDESQETGFARIMGANNDLLLSIDMLSAKNASPESTQSKLGITLSMVSIQLIEGTLHITADPLLKP